MKPKLSIEEKKAANSFLSFENSKIFKLKLNELSHGLRNEKQKKGKEKKK